MLSVSVLAAFSYACSGAVRLLRKTKMKNTEKRKFLAKKILLSVFVFIVGMLTFNQLAFGVVGDACADRSFEECASAEGVDGPCRWYDNACFSDKLVVECSQKTTWAGCFLKKGCIWYSRSATGTKCVPKSDKKKAKSDWKEEDCDSKYFKTLSEYTITKDGVTKKSPVEACKYLVKEKIPVCEYPHWLNNKGKRKCRGYFKSRAKAENQLCVEQVENIWQRSLKTSEDREARREGMDRCDRVASYTSYYEEDYSGPVFDGVGLRGGAQMAQMKLSNSISKQRDLKKLLISWSKFALEIAAVIAVLALIYAGFRYITDMGDGGGVEAAKKIIIWVIVGLLLILSAYAIVNTVIKARFGADDSRASLTINKIIT